MQRKKVEVNVGDRFGYLTITKTFSIRIDNRKVLMCECLCDCGTLKEIAKGNVVRGNTISCGCYKENQIRTIAIRHGMRYHPLYLLWRRIRNRCFNPKDKDYLKYGARGITFYNK